MNEEKSDQLSLKQWTLYYLLLLVFGVSLGGGIPVLLIPCIHHLVLPARGITTHYPMEGTIDVPDVLDLAKIDPEDMSKHVPNAYMASFTRTSLYPAEFGIDSNLISREIFLNGRRVSFDYGGHGKGSILSTGKAMWFKTSIPLEKLTPGEHCFTLVLFQRYDPKMQPPPKATVVTKYFTVIDSSLEEKL